MNCKSLFFVRKVWKSTNVRHKVAIKSGISSIYMVEVWNLWFFSIKEPEFIGIKKFYAVKYCKKSRIPASSTRRGLFFLNLEQPNKSLDSIDMTIQIWILKFSLNSFLSVLCIPHYHLLFPWNSRYFEGQWTEGCPTSAFETICVTLGFLEWKPPQQMRQENKNLHLCQPFTQANSPSCWLWKKKKNVFYRVLP